MNEKDTRILPQIARKNKNCYKNLQHTFFIRAKTNKSDKYRNSCARMLLKTKQSCKIAQE